VEAVRREVSETWTARVVLHVVPEQQRPRRQMALRVDGVERDGELAIRVYVTARTVVRSIQHTQGMTDILELVVQSGRELGRSYQTRGDLVFTTVTDEEGNRETESLSAQVYGHITRHLCPRAAVILVTIWRGGSYITESTQARPSRAYLEEAAGAADIQRVRELRAEIREAGYERYPGIQREQFLSPDVASYQNAAGVPMPSVVERTIRAMRDHARALNHLRDTAGQAMGHWMDSIDIDAINTGTHAGVDQMLRHWTGQSGQAAIMSYIDDHMIRDWTVEGDGDDMPLLVSERVTTRPRAGEDTVPPTTEASHVTVEVDITHLGAHHTVALNIITDSGVVHTRYLHNRGRGDAAAVLTDIRDIMVEQNIETYTISCDDDSYFTNALLLSHYN
jgi:hypothetical protein